GHFALHFLFRLDVDLGADQLRGQADVEPALADGQRELVVVHDDVEVRAMRGLVAGDRDAGNLGRGQRVLGEVDDVFLPGDDVDLLAAQLTDDGLHAGALHADARADRIDVALARAHRDLGPLARLAHRALDDHRAVVDLRHFHLEQLDQQSRSGARKPHLRALRVVVDVDDARLDPVALRVALRPPAASAG